MKKKTIDWLINSGLWIPPVIIGGVCIYLKVSGSDWLAEKSHVGLLVGGSFIPWLVIIAENAGKPKADKAFRGRDAAMYPPVDKRLLFSKPTGVVLGRDIRTGKYICRPTDVDGHIIIVGASGSGKSSTILIPTLLLGEMTIFAIDVKGELHQIATKIGDPKVRVFEPLNRESWGYDPFYALTEKSSNQEIYEAMVNIANALVPMPNSSNTDKFWIISPRNLLTACLIFYYKQGYHNFIDCVNKILGAPITDVINEIFEGSKLGSNEKQYITPFHDLAEETLSGISTTMYNAILIFSNDSALVYALKTNPNKINPRMLEDKYSIYISVPEHKLAPWYDLFQLILNQTMLELSKRPEHSHKILMAIDEMPRILSGGGRLELFLDAIHTIRSKGVCMLLVTQATESLMSAYTENEVSDIMSNCIYKVVLTNSSEKTEKAIIHAAGRFIERKTSWNNTGKGTNSTVSYEKSEIIDSADMQELMLKNEAILLTPYGYCRAKKTPYYSDRYLKKKAEEIKKYNDSILSITKEENHEQK